MDPHPFVKARSIALARPAPPRRDPRGTVALVAAALLAAALASMIAPTHRAAAAASVSA